MSGEMIRSQLFDFDGKQRAALWFRGRRCMVVSDLEAALGYAPKGLSALIGREWADEFDDGDIEIVKGKDLKDLKEVYVFYTATPDEVDDYRFAASLTLIYEEAIWLVLLKTNKEPGKRLRKLLKNKVMPALARGDDLVKHEVIDSPAMLREKRLGAKLAMELAERVATETGVRGPAIGAWFARILGKLTGESVTSLLPALNEHPFSPSEMAKEFGVTAARVGLTITKLDLRGDKPGLCQRVFDTASHSPGKTVEAFRYTAKAKEMIRQQLIADGHLREDGTPFVAELPGETSN